MAVELRVPEVGESITEVQIGSWFKKEGDAIQRDEALVEIESDKATLELPAPVSGVLSKVLKKKGEMAKVGDLIAEIGENGAAKPAAKSAGAKSAAASAPAAPASAAPAASRAAAPAPAAPTPTTPRTAEPRVMPSARRALAENDLSVADVAPSGPGGRVLKEDVLDRLASRPAGTTTGAPGAARGVAPPAMTRPSDAERVEEAVPMSPMRLRIAERLKEAQNTAALLTTFNEIDMTQVVTLREELREAFQERFGVKLGFMSFFVKATIDALMQFPQVNAEVRGKEIVYKNYYDIGIAVGGGKGLVVPVLRNAEHMSFAEIEIAIADFAARARENKLHLDELKGGTFTVSNGGVYGSLLSTPIVNPPQSGILGLHAIQKRPVVVNDEIAIRPMMYAAVTYDHRVIDGRESVAFLKHIKDLVERPTRMLLGI
ncbi:MAG: 2-oxoglutarate dehydrogenase complex dihydrolipoyllysine-residue succinyltransferase [Candidatus Eisenbacteria bacterium]|uniref:Dihydrolipoyllysine-residue succinyltransferase component of 2-oxoglutarate dehydrogenase complex n=1 Tax=Eiseniibacteriota bacterium TaxID=2212470 RepID=A0A538THK1_UNCEI|nr:MAG: 2-oxoglutarate dehydrogenase complex dihydrolipoyllysine-residue succinyltransferase [Candidatus Eisenbacteria bacterium]